ncbi:hypothetical protein PSH66_13675 [Pseudomonas sp. FP597]|uniref:DUF6896 domain-containing protein n=1 Tax=Pseudomonas sp. FP597 TaxID=2954096 RepID=UPI002734F854|nr:hypothetical protein [Pseudomonas sp. FP597]WLI09330.1 hypothetical protein PSH66_13675 [Pseudomonas sp. FP597]
MSTHSEPKIFWAYVAPKKIPQRGSIANEVTYELHGIGCRVYLAETCIDFDYGPDERIDGFDRWRLYMYACELPLRYQKHINKDVVGA